jgi:hypothetical protein
MEPLARIMLPPADGDDIRQLTNAARRLARPGRRGQFGRVGAKTDRRCRLVDRGPRRMQARQIVTQHHERCPPRSTTATATVYYRYPDQAPRQQG